MWGKLTELFFKMSVSRNARVLFCSYSKVEFVLCRMLIWLWGIFCCSRVIISLRYCLPESGQFHGYAASAFFLKCIMNVSCIHWWRLMRVMITSKLLLIIKLLMVNEMTECYAILCQFCNVFWSVVVTSKIEI